MGWLVRFTLPWFHPAVADLVDWADEVVGPDNRTDRHLKRCAPCRVKAQLIRGAAQKARGHGSADPMLAGTLDRLQARMRNRRSPVEERLTIAVETYFGREAVHRMPAAADAPGRHRVLRMKPLFSAFLGASAADALAEQIAGVEC